MFRSKSGEAFYRPVYARLRSTVEPMFNYEKARPFIGSNHEGEMALSRRLTGILSTEVNEVRSSLVSPILFHDPITLLVEI